MTDSVKHIVIVGGGTAGWITAGVLAAQHCAHPASRITVTLIESPDISPIGVGEGTWPSMRSTLQQMGISETEFIRECDASFKQGSCFSGWVTGSESDRYYHPFTPPQGYSETNLAAYWQLVRDKVNFADAVSPQSRLCDKGLAPKKISTPEYAFNANYGYHLDAGKFAIFLQKYCVEKLGVNHILDTVTAVNADDSEYLVSVTTSTQGDISGDLFVDCSGFSALLIGQHYKIPFCSKKDILFNDTALAVQIPYAKEGDPIASHTLSTAQTAGWIWDIGLPSRRGVGYVYSSAHISDEDAEIELRQYISNSSIGFDADKVSLRKLMINPGHRQKLWHKNCVAVGMASGFIEPLEASALVLVEQSAKMISEQLPATREVMEVVSKRFNDKFLYHWDSVIQFLKLHYVLSKRQDTAYWRDNRRTDTIPDSLQDLLTLWRYQAPWHQDAPLIDELFPSASFQYVLYGMGFETVSDPSVTKSGLAAKSRADTLFQENARKTQQLLTSLPATRELIDKVRQYGFQKI
ncbi:MAG: tryptophan halogenase family protein [Pseudomonadales bacterium]